MSSSPSDRSTARHDRPPLRAWGFDVSGSSVHESARPRSETSAWHSWTRRLVRSRTSDDPGADDIMGPTFQVHDVGTGRPAGMLGAAGRADSCARIERTNPSAGAVPPGCSRSRLAATIQRSVGPGSTNPAPATGRRRPTADVSRRSRRRRQGSWWSWRAPSSWSSSSWERPSWSSPVAVPAPW